jgi:hypothetical protein
VIDLLADPWTWFLGGFVLACVVLFAGSVVSRRSAPLPALILAGVLFGGGAVLSLQSPPWRLQDLSYALLGVGVAWSWLAVPGLLAALIQPGEPAPVLPGRALRHLGLAAAWVIVTSVMQPDLGIFFAPAALVAAGSVRAGQRVERAWWDAMALQGNTLALWMGALLAYVTPEIPAVESLLPCWVAVQGAAMVLELRRWPRAPGLLLAAAWLAVGLGVNWPLLAAERQVARLSAGHTLPRCERDFFSWLEPEMTVGTVQEPQELVVADVHDDLGPLFGQPFRLACVYRDERGDVYRQHALSEGVGVEVAREGERVLLASGEELDEQTLALASQRCGLPFPALSPRPGGRWPAQELLTLCERWSCRAGPRRCTFLPGPGWHVP